jgi:hypothetical protein
MIETLASSDAAVAKHLGKAVYTVDEVKTIDLKIRTCKSKATMLQMLGYGLPVELKVAVQNKKKRRKRPLLMVTILKQITVKL